MSTYMSRLFSKSNSSFLLRSGNALEAKVVRLRKERYLLDTGLGQPITATANELVKPPISDRPISFSQKVGFLNPVRGESTVRTILLQRCFVDLVTGDARTKLLAAGKFEDLVGKADAASSGERPILLPRSFRKHRAWLELKNMKRANKKVRGFVAAKVKGGYSVGIAGYLAFLPYKQIIGRRFDGDRFIIQTLTPRNFVVGVGGSPANIRRDDGMGQGV